MTLHPKTREPIVKAHLHDPTNDASNTNSPALGPAEMRDDVYVNGYSSDCVREELIVVLDHSSIRSIASKKSTKGAKPTDTLPTSMSGLSIQNGTGGDQENVVVFLVSLPVLAASSMEKLTVSGL